MKKITSLLFAALIVMSCATQQLKSSLTTLPTRNINVIVASDMARRGISDQKNVAELMAQVAKNNNISFMAVAGDPIHDDGVKSVDDNEWTVKIENIYNAKSLQNLPWYVVSGNHEYLGNTQAILDYSKKSKRWNAPDKYYSITRTIPGSNDQVLFVFIDTAPMIDQYYKHPEKYPDAAKQDVPAQLNWIKQTLASSKARWKIVIGHHPVYAQTDKDDAERTDMQTRLGAILEQNGASMYICGHIHTFQHIRPKGSKVEYFVNSSAAETRKVEPMDGTIFCKADPGFSVLSISPDKIDYYMENAKGEIIYNYTLNK